MKKEFNNAKDLIAFIESQRRFDGIKDLSQMDYFLSLFDHPEKDLPIIHVGGTNGKGSVVSFLKMIYLEKGLNVATFTSPYVDCFNERITFNNHYISDVDLLKFGNMILAKYDEIESSDYHTPSFFEFITLLAFLYFHSLNDLDLVILEVGLGGRLDATNVVIPLISCVTSIGYDHMKQLGNTLEEIALEKAGIIKKNVPFVACVKDELKEVFLRKGKEENSDISFVNLDDIKIKSMDEDYLVFDYLNYKDLKTPMLGLHQAQNAALVIEVARVLGFHKNKFAVSYELLKRALLKTQWLGRLEKVSSKPLIYLDGGHNRDCFEKIADFAKSFPQMKKRAIIAISKDKEIDAMLKIIDGVFDEIVFTTFTYYRSADVETLMSLSNLKNTHYFISSMDAIKYVENSPMDLNIFFGSLYFISEIRPYFKK